MALQALFCVLGALIGTAGWLIIAGTVALAEEQQNMSPGMATGMENAFAVPFRALQLQNVFRFEDSNRGDKIYRVEPELRWGVVRNGFLSVRSPLAFGPGEGQDSGNLQVQGFYAVMNETQALPATALVVGATMPTGKQAAGVDPLARAILTKTAERVQYSLNAELSRNAGAPIGEREFRYRFGIGADVGETNLIRTGLFVEQDKHQGIAPQWNAQVGYFYRLTPAVAMAVGAQVGLSSSAPDYQVIFGYQHTFEGLR